MTNPAQSSTLLLTRSLPAAAFALALVCALTVVATQSAHAQTLQVLHNFTGGGDGAYPATGLTMDGAGNLYGTTAGNDVLYGNCSYPDCGSVFKMVHRGSGWSLTPLYTFPGGSDGELPSSSLIFGPDGALYGPASGGNLCFGSQYCGIVFRLSPPATACRSALCGWSETVLHRFSGSDGAFPSRIIFDPAGNIFGETGEGGNSGCEGGSCGTIYQMTPSGGGWTESVIYAFTGVDDGYGPDSGLTLDIHGNLYGTTGLGGPPQGGGGPKGTVFELTPSGSGWSKSILYTFEWFNDGAGPAGVIFDPYDDIYGPTEQGGMYARGTVFELIPSNPGTWLFSQLYQFQWQSGDAGPSAPLIMDAAGNLYGTTLQGGAYGNGAVYELTPTDNGWVYSSLHDFTGGSDGRWPSGGLIFDGNGNLYGTTELGGTGTCSIGSGCGVVWEITP